MLQLRQSFLIQVITFNSKDKEQIASRSNKIYVWSDAVDCTHKSIWSVN